MKSKEKLDLNKLKKYTVYDNKFYVYIVNSKSKIYYNDILLAGKMS